jgi:hypothetical protein
MRKRLGFLVIAITIPVLLTYLFIWYDLIENGQTTGYWIQDFRHSISCYFLAVLPYWWLLILIAAAILLTIQLVLDWLFVNLRRANSQ